MVKKKNNDSDLGLNLFKFYVCVDWCYKKFFIMKMDKLIMLIVNEPKILLPLFKIHNKKSNNLCNKSSQFYVLGPGFLCKCYFPMTLNLQKKPTVVWKFQKEMDPHKSLKFPSIQYNKLSSSHLNPRDIVDSFSVWRLLFTDSWVSTTLFAKWRKFRRP